jgi:hypothetical protein
MSEVYIANILETFQSEIIAVALLIGLGVLAIPMVFFGKRGVVSRIVIGACSVFLIVAGLAVGAVTVSQYNSGSKILTARLTQKQVVETEDSEGNGTIETYRLFFGDVTAFDVPQSAYAKMTVQNCYQLTYYPAKGLLEMLGQSTNVPPTTSGAVSSIKQDNNEPCK